MPNPAKVALFLEEANVPYETVPVDTSKGEQHLPAFRKINPNGKVPAIVDTEGPGGRERVFSISARSCSIWRRKPGSSLARRRTGRSCCPGCSLSHQASGLSQARRCTSSLLHPRDWTMPATAIDAKRSDTAKVLEDHLAGRDYFIGDFYTIADISTWGWIDRASRILKGEGDPLAPYPNIKRWFEAIEACPVVARARAVDTEHSFKEERDEEALRALFPSNYPATA